jgi:hypothetical protein
MVWRNLELVFLVVLFGTLVAWLILGYFWIGPGS